jgi:hypothetical protein
MAPGCPACPPGPCALNFAATCASWRRSIPRRTTRPGSASECLFVLLWDTSARQCARRGARIDTWRHREPTGQRPRSLLFLLVFRQGVDRTLPAPPPRTFTHATHSPLTPARALTPPPPTPPQARPCRAPRRGGPQLCREGAHRGAATQRRLQQLHANLHRYAHLQPAALPHLPSCSSSVRVRRTRPPHPALPCPPGQGARARRGACPRPSRPAL